ncbi:SCO family protein [Aureimonas frigidaquae]|uniref:SCO family protein n=1 Tax=Aureimonas frigidaquae TaxID=424757 RepID=UPI0007857632|nr:SCO family protein [Aureimonas frigidaquae]
MRRARLFLLTLCGVTIGASLYAVATIMSPTPPVASGGGAASRPAIGGPFQLVDTRGAPVTQADFAGKPSAIFFGFTHCPDVCPTTLMELAGLMRDLGADADRLNAIFVSVDPERDTPSDLQAYVEAFDPRIRALTGSPEQIRAMTDAFRVHVERVPLGDGYTIDHTASVYLMDGSNSFFGTISYEEDAQMALAKLRRLVSAG